MDKEAAEKKAKEIVKLVVCLLSQKRYEDLADIVEMDVLTPSDVKELVDEYLELNDLTHLDDFDVKCNFNPRYEYHQMTYYHYNDGSGFHVDYDLTTDEELNDLTLQMEFIYNEKDTLKAKLMDLHVM